MLSLSLSSLIALIVDKRSTACLILGRVVGDVERLGK